MAAYVISEVEMLDETQGRRYRELAAGSIARHGGRYLVRGAAPVVAEGTGQPASASSSWNSRAWSDCGPGTPRPTTPRPWPSGKPPWTVGSSSSTGQTSHPASAGRTPRKTVPLNHPLVSRRNQPQLPATEPPRCDIEPHSAR